MRSLRSSVDSLDEVIEIEESYGIKCFYQLFLQTLRVNSDSGSLEETSDENFKKIVSLVEGLLLKRKLYNEEVVTNIFKLLTVYAVLNEGNVQYLFVILVTIKLVIIVFLPEVQQAPVPV